MNGRRQVTSVYANSRQTRTGDSINCVIDWRRQRANFHSGPSGENCDFRWSFALRTSAFKLKVGAKVNVNSERPESAAGI